MDFAKYLIENFQPLLFGLALIGLGAIFWYMPNTKLYIDLRKNHLEIVNESRKNGNETSAIKIEAVHKDAISRLPMYGKILMVFGVIISNYGIYNAL